MKILYISRACTPHAGGMERLSFELLQHLKKQPQFEVHSITRSKTSRVGAIYFAFRHIAQAITQAHQVDIVHIGDPVVSLTGWLIKVITKKPVVVTVHGLDVSYPNLVYQLYLRLFFRNFDLYLPISQHAKQLLGSKRPNGQVVILTPGISDQYFNTTITRATWTTEPELRPLVHHTNKIVLATVGRLVNRKGHGWFIQNVLPHLPTNVTYVVAGTGPELEPLKETIAKINQHDRVVLLGRISDSAIRILYNTIDGFIQPNIPVAGDAEGFGLVLLEAALCNKPVFAANLEGITSAITSEKNGFLLEPLNAAEWIKKLETYIKEPEKMNLRSREYTQTLFSWDRFMQQYRHHIEKIDSHV